MATTANKVKFNLSNVHYSLLTLSDTGEPTYATPKAIPGAVSLSLEPNGEATNFYADGYAYYTLNNNIGYTGDLEIALIPESFLIDCLGETKSADGVLIENTNAQLAKFALLFEFEGDARKIRHVLYNCTAARPSLESATATEDREVQTETLSITAMPLSDGKVKAKTGNDVAETAEAYTKWYTNVYLPTAEEG